MFRYCSGEALSWIEPSCSPTFGHRLDATSNHAQRFASLGRKQRAASLGPTVIERLSGSTAPSEMRLLPHRLRARFAATHDNHKRIARGALWTGLFVVAAKCFVAAREVVIAWRFGVSATVDAYQMAFALVTWVPMALAAICTAVLVPRLVALKRADNDQKLFLKELNGAAILAGGALVVLTIAVTEVAFGLFNVGEGSTLASTTRTMVLQLSPIALFLVVAGYLATRLQAQEQYSFSFVEALPPIAIILFIVIAPLDAGGSPLVWGTLVGSLLPIIALLLMIRRRGDEIGSLSFARHSPTWHAIYVPLALMAGAQLIQTATIPIDQFFAAAAGEGAVSEFSYANRIVGLATTLGYVVFARALLPILSGAAAEGDRGLGRRQALQWSSLLFGIGAGMTLVGWLAAPLAVKLLFERGAFSPEDTLLVAELVRYGLLQLPFFFAGVALVQWIAATNRYHLFLMLNGGALAVKLAANLILFPRFGVPGLMLSTALMYFVILVMLIMMSRPLPAKQ